MLGAFEAEAKREDELFAGIEMFDQGAYGFVTDLSDFAYLDYDIVTLYEGYNDLPQIPPRGGANYLLWRRSSPVFRWTGYYPLLPVALREKADALTGVKSKAMTSPCGKIRIPINEEGNEKAGQIQEYLVRHVRQRCPDPRGRGELRDEDRVCRTMPSMRTRTFTGQRLQAGAKGRGCPPVHPRNGDWLKANRRCHECWILGVQIVDIDIRRGSTRLLLCLRTCSRRTGRRRRRRPRRNWCTRSTTA